MKSSAKAFLKHFPAVLILLGLLAFGNVLNAQDTGSTVYKKDNLEVRYKPVSTGVSIELVNRTEKDLTNVQLTSADIPNLKTANRVLKVAKVPARSIQTFNVTYQLPGATDKNPNTPATSMRFLPRTGTMQLLYTGGAILLIGLAAGGVVLVRNRKIKGGKTLMSLLLAGGILVSAGLMPQRSQAAEKDREIKVPITGTFAIGQHQFNYKGELAFRIKDVKEVNETRTEVVKFAKKIEIDQNLPVVKDDNTDNVSIKQKGVDGKKEIVTKVTYVNGQKLKEEKISEQITVKPVDEITLLGGKTVERKQTTAPGTEYVADETRAVGEPHKVLVNGVAGETVKAYMRSKDGKLEQVEKETQKVVARKLAVANKQLADQSETVAYETTWQGEPDTVYDRTAATIVKAGVDGSKRSVKFLQVNPKTGALGAVYKEESLVEQEPVDEIKSLGQLYEVVTDLPFAEEQQPDAQKPVGWSEVVQEGKNGRSTRILRGTVDTKTGALIKSDHDVQVGSEQRTEPQNRIVKVGTGELQTKEQTVTTTIPFKRIYQPTDTLPFGQHKTVTPGAVGTKTELVKVPWDPATDTELTIEGYKPEVVKTEVKDPTDEVIAVGVYKVERVEIPAGSVPAVETEAHDKWQGWRQVTKAGVPGINEVKTRYQMDAKGQVTDVVEGTPETEVIARPQAEEARVGTDGRMDQEQSAAWLSEVRKQRAEADRADLTFSSEATAAAEQAAYDCSKGKQSTVADDQQLFLIKKPDYDANDAEKAKKTMDQVYSELLDSSPAVKEMLLKGKPKGLGVAFYQAKDGKLFVALVIDKD